MLKLPCYLDRGLGHDPWVVDIDHLTGGFRKDCRQQSAGFIQATVDVDPSVWRQCKVAGDPIQVVKRKAVVEIVRYEERRRHPEDRRRDAEQERGSPEWWQKRQREHCHGDTHP